MHDFINDRNKKLFTHDWESLKGAFQVNLRKAKRQKFASSLRFKTQDFDQPAVFDSLEDLLSNFQLRNEDDLKNTCIQLVDFSFKGQKEVDLMVSSGIIEFCLAHLSSSQKSVSEYSLLTLSNIAATGPYYRLLLINSSSLQSISELILSEESQASFLKTAACTLRNMIQEDVKLETSSLSTALLTINKLLALGVPDINLSCFYVIRALATQGGIDGIIKHLDLIFLNAKIETENEGSILAIEVLLNITTYSNQYSSLLIEKGIIELIFNKLSSDDPSLIKKTLKMLYNLLESPSNSVHFLLQSQVFVKILPFFSHQKIGIKTEASFIFLSLSRLSKLFNVVSTFKLIHENCLFQHLSASLACKSETLISNITVFLEGFLRISQDSFPISRQELFDSGLYSALEKSAISLNTIVANRIDFILSVFDDDLSDYQVG